MIIEIWYFNGTLRTLIKDVQLHVAERIIRMLEKSQNL